MSQDPVLSDSLPGKELQDTIPAIPSVKKVQSTDSLTVAEPVDNNLVQDSVTVAEHVKKKFTPDPLRATMLAVVFPGLGQIYNRKYWKIPVVYAGFGALIYSAGFNSKNYITYMTAYQDFTDQIAETDSYVELIPADQSTYDPVVYPIDNDPATADHDPATAQNYKDQMLRMVDSYKRYRDLSYIGIAVWYLVSILDANVDASLYNFDVSNNLDIAVAPMQFHLPGGYMGAGLNVRCKINF
jgi:hypothetical protein